MKGTTTFSSIVAFVGPLVAKVRQLEGILDSG